MTITRSLWSLENMPTPNTSDMLVSDLERLYDLGVVAVGIDGDAQNRYLAKRKRMEAMAAHPSNGNKA